MAELEHVLYVHRDDFHPIVPFDPFKNKIIKFDMTSANPDLTEEIISDLEAYSHYINQHLSEAGALYGIGGYGEHRTVYGRSKLFDGGEGSQEPRRLHLGLDIWGNAGTPIFAPLDSVVHSFAFNDRFGDYGATIILSHELDGDLFYSLYGHLSIADLEPITTGMRISKGSSFAHMGLPHENGHWPPHLHFQLIVEIGDAKGDYPGVCKYSEREKYLSNSPDPDMIARLSRFAAV